MIKVIKLSDIIKYLLKLTIPIIILVVIFQVFSKKSERKAKLQEVSTEETINQENSNKTNSEDKETERNDSKEIKESSNEAKNKDENEKALMGLIKDNLTELILKDEEKENKDNQEEKKKKYAFMSELEIMESLKLAEDKTLENQENDENNKETNNENNKVNSSQEVIQARTDVTTEAVPNAVNPRFTNEYNGVKINNGTDFALTEEMLTPDIEVNKSKVAIYHTHTCESYTATENYNYTPSGNYRSTDLNFSVARVGDELESQLNSYGISVIHDKTYHDYPAYNGSYGRSLVTAERILAENSDIDIVIDLHRDAIADESYAPKVKIGDEYASQLMFVMGTNGAGSSHDNWNQNLKFAIKVMLKANELYPGLFKPIILRNTEYNQHVAKGACIIEVGSTGNTLEESMNSMKYLAKILSEI